MNGLAKGMLVLAGASLLPIAGRRLVQISLRRLRDDHRSRPALWDRFYTLDWGDTETNNYGFAPADPDDDAPDRYQRQMYRELLKLLKGSREFEPGTRLLEVSCGRGGGLSAFLDAAGSGAFEATGLDVAASAVRYCKERYKDRDGLSFVEGNALDLPFPEGSFDVLLNVEASNDYPDRPRFFAEVRRVLKADGVFLYADTEKSKNAGRMAAELEAAGFRFALRDGTANVAEACRLDTPRRRALIEQRAPRPARLLFRRELSNYAAIEGSKKYCRFVDRERLYHMTAAVPV